MASDGRSSTSQPLVKDAAVTARPRAYSYIRWSTPDQGKGDSLHRQTEAARAYAARHGLELDETLDITDPGVSAHYGKNVAAGKLRAFLEAVRDGIVSRGSFLLVESLDRISRQTVWRAVSTMREIVEAGITLVDLSDNGKRYSADTLDNDPGGLSFMMMALRFMRAHEESAIKSSRGAAAYTRKRQQAAARTDTDKPFTRMLPAWLQCHKETRQIEEVPERAKVVQDVFKMADAGLGQHAIAQRLNAEGVPTFGGRGKQRRADAWHRTYIKKLLTNSAVVGTFTPHQRRTDAQGKGHAEAGEEGRGEVCIWPRVPGEAEGKHEVRGAWTGSDDHRKAQGDQLARCESTTQGHGTGRGHCRGASGGACNGTQK